SGWSRRADSNWGYRSPTGTSPTGRSQAGIWGSDLTRGCVSTRPRCGSPARAGGRPAVPAPESREPEPPEVEPERILAALNEHGVRHVLIGGVAEGVRAQGGGGREQDRFVLPVLRRILDEGDAHLEGTRYASRGLPSRDTPSCRPSSSLPSPLTLLLPARSDPVRGNGRDFMR